MVSIYKGTFFSFLTIILWATSNIFLRYGLLELGCNQFAVACSNVLFSGLALIAIGGRNTNVKEIITNHQTWVFGALQIFRNLFMLMAFVYISSTQANLIANVEVIFSVLLAWAIFGRKPGFIDFVAMVFILFGCFILVADLPMDTAIKAIVFVMISALLNNMRTVFAELHHDNRANLSIRDRLSLTGWILFVSAITFMIVAAVLSTVVSCLPESFLETFEVFKLLPKPMEYIAPNNILCGLINGVLIYAASMYCYLYAVSLSNSEYFMMIHSSQSLFTYFAESIAAAFALLPALSFSAIDWFAAMTIMISSACMVLMRTRRGKALEELIHRAFR